MRLITYLAILLLPTQLLAQTITCKFTTECFESDPCAESAFEADVLIPEEKISTEFGDLTIVALKQSDTLKTLFATGAGAEYMLSISSSAARMTTHMNDGPLSVSYLGTCEGAF